VQQVKLGNQWGVVYMAPNFTVDLLQRMENNVDPDIMYLHLDLVSLTKFHLIKIIYQSTLHVYLDLSNYQVAELIKQKLLQSFESEYAFNSFAPLNYLF
jgi:hypothetical protein